MIVKSGDPSRWSLAGRRRPPAAGRAQRRSRVPAARSKHGPITSVHEASSSPPPPSPVSPLGTPTPGDMVRARRCRGSRPARGPERAPVSGGAGGCGCSVGLTSVSAHRYRAALERGADNCMIDSFTVRTFKSLEDVTVDLGRVNVFIGANGGGKSNLLEAIGVLSAAASGRVDDQSLLSRGVRPGVPQLYKSVFAARPGKKIPPHLFFGAHSAHARYEVSLHNPLKEPTPAWRFKTESWEDGSRRFVGRSPATASKSNPERGLAALKAVDPVGLSGGKLPSAILELLKLRRRDGQCRSRVEPEVCPVIDRARLWMVFGSASATADIADHPQPARPGWIASAE